MVQYFSGSKCGKILCDPAIPSYLKAFSFGILMAHKTSGTVVVDMVLMIILIILYVVLLTAFAVLCFLIIYLGLKT